MKLKFKTLFLSLLYAVLILAVAVGFAACGSAGGTYYLVNPDGSTDVRSYLKLDGSSWTDNDGITGTYKVDGETITLYLELSGNKINYNEGTIKGGVITLEGFDGREVYVSNKHKHSYGEWAKKSTASCTANGLDTRRCTVCGYNETRVNEVAKGHSLQWLMTNSGHSEACVVCGVQTQGNAGHVATSDGKLCATCGYPMADTEGLEFKLNNSGDGYILTDFGAAKNETAIRIPATHESLPVTKVLIGHEKGEYEAGKFTTVVIPDSVTEIGEWTFDHCTNLKNVVIGSSVTTIGQDAFYGCESLQSITVPDNVNTIKSNAFYLCKSLTNVNLGSGLLEVSNNMFAGCESLERITIPNGVGKIGVGAFEYCTNLKSVTLPNTVYEIGKRAFAYCENLADINIPEGVTEIGSQAFLYCDKAVETAGGAQYVGSWVVGSEQKSEVTLREGTKGIAESAVDSSYLKKLHVPASLRIISANNAVARLDTVDIYISDLASWCAIEKSAIYQYNLYLNNQLVTELTIPNTVKEIADGAFRSCASITKLTLPRSLTKIGSDAFFLCDNLTDIYYGGTQEEWNNNSFGNILPSGTSNITVHYNSD